MRLDLNYRNYAPRKKAPAFIGISRRKKRRKKAAQRTKKAAQRTKIYEKKPFFSVIESLFFDKGFCCGFFGALMARAVELNAAVVGDKAAAKEKQKEYKKGESLEVN
jgi:hypothetical protein